MDVCGAVYALYGTDQVLVELAARGVLGPGLATALWRLVANPGRPPCALGPQHGW